MAENFESMRAEQRLRAMDEPIWQMLRTSALVGTRKWMSGGWEILLHHSGWFDLALIQWTVQEDPVDRCSKSSGLLGADPRIVDLAHSAPMWSGGVESG